MAFGFESDPKQGRENYTVRYDNAASEWVLMKDGASRAVRREGSKSSLLPQARSIAQNNAPAILTVKGMNGGTTNQNVYD